MATAVRHWRTPRRGVDRHVRARGARHPWIYDGVHDPVVMAQLRALLRGESVPQHQSKSDTPDPTVTVHRTGPGRARRSHQPHPAADRDRAELVRTPRRPVDLARRNGCAGVLAAVARCGKRSRTDSRRAATASGSGVRPSGWVVRDRRIRLRTVSMRHETTPDLSYRRWRHRLHHPPAATPGPCPGRRPDHQPHLPQQRRLNRHRTSPIDGLNHQGSRPSRTVAAAPPVNADALTGQKTLRVDTVNGRHTGNGSRSRVAPSVRPTSCVECWSAVAFGAGPEATSSPGDRGPEVVPVTAEHRCGEFSGWAFWLKASWWRPARGRIGDLQQIALLLGGCRPPRSSRRLGQLGWVGAAEGGEEGVLGEVGFCQLRTQPEGQPVCSSTTTMSSRKRSRRISKSAAPGPMRSSSDSWTVAARPWIPGPRPGLETVLVGVVGEALHRLTAFGSG